MKSRRTLRLEIAIMNAWLAFAIVAAAGMAWLFVTVPASNGDGRVLCALLSAGFTVGAACVWLHLSMARAELRTRRA